jgi:hypothetical protein
MLARSIDISIVKLLYSLPIPKALRLVSVVVRRSLLPWWKNTKCRGDISGSHCGGYEDNSLLGYFPDDGDSTHL